MNYFKVDVSQNKVLPRWFQFAFVSSGLLGYQPRECEWLLLHIKHSALFHALAEELWHCFDTFVFKKTIGKIRPWGPVVHGIRGQSFLICFATELLLQGQSNRGSIKNSSKSTE